MGRSDMRSWYFKSQILRDGSLELQMHICDVNHSQSELSVPSLTSRRLPGRVASLSRLLLGDIILPLITIYIDLQSIYHRRENEDCYVSGEMK